MMAERVTMQVVMESGEVVETPLSQEDLKLAWKRSACPYCGVGCGLMVGAQDGRVKKVRGDQRHPANFGLICAKGATVPHMVHTDDRLSFPMMRSTRQGSLERTSWSAALNYMAERWRAIIDQHGPDAVAFYVSGQLLTEDYYLVNKLAKAVLGTNNVDSNSRLCMASAVTGYVSSLGADAPPGCYADIELADCFLLIGTNTAACHPITFERIRRRKMCAPDRVQVIVVDPRRTRTADIADIFLPVRPGTDVALLNAMVHICIRDGLVDERFIEAHTVGWDEVSARAKECSPERAAELCGLDVATIEAAARVFGRSRAAMSFWAMGVNQSTHGTAKTNSLINLHLATGQIGRAGAGPFSLTGQPNAMGGRETGGLSHLLPGYRFVINAVHRSECERLWNVPAGRLSPQPGLDAVELFNALERGTLKSVWIMATNPMVSMPQLSKVRRALERAELVIVSDAYHPTETTQRADIVLPAAQWSERDGTVTNSERAISYLEQVVDPPGEALPDWVAVCRFAHAMAVGDAFEFDTVEEVFEEYKQFTVGRQTDIGGVTYDRLRAGPIQWPCQTVQHRSTMRRYTDGIFAHPDSKARFLYHEYEAPSETTDPDYPLVLNTGRVRDQWHTMTRTGKIPMLLKREPKPFIEVHPDDAAVLGVSDGAWVTIHSRRGSARARSRITNDICRGSCFMPFHWGSLWGQAVVNEATHQAVDATSKQPELKYCAVRLEPGEKHD